MFYPTHETLPDDLRRELPHAAAELYRTTFNAAYAAQGSDYEQAGKIAWAAVHTHFEKGAEGAWQPRSTRPPVL